MRYYRIFNKLLRKPLCNSNIRHIGTRVDAKTRIFSGIQPTGEIHLGNYLGAVTQWLEYQKNHQNLIVMIADCHSLTLPHNPEQLRKNIVNVTATLLACGVNPNEVILFQQSDVLDHTFLSWCLECELATMARLAHLPAYKEKTAALKDIPVGLFTYPVLQAADILAYKSTHVPVGEDQMQHIQLAREYARMFNKRYGETFPLPELVIRGKEFARLKSLRDPMKKMSKSDKDPKSRISLTDSSDQIVSKIKKAVTDCISEVTYDPESRPGVSNLISIHSFLTNQPITKICEEASSLDTGRYKSVVADVVVEFIKPIRERIMELLKDEIFIEEMLESCAASAREISEETVREVKHKLGLSRSVRSKRKANVLVQS